MANIYQTDFPEISKAQWLERVSKDLKDKALADLYWQLQEGITVDPFGHADDFETPPQPLYQTPINWEICERVSIGDPAAANRQILNALEGGTEGLECVLDKGPTPQALSLALDGVYMDFIGLHFSGHGAAENPAFLLSQVIQLAKTKGQYGPALRGSIAYDPANQSERPDWRYLIDFVEYAQQEARGFRCIQVRPSQAAEGPITELSGLLRMGQHYLEQLSKRGLSAEKTARQLQFEIPVGKSYFVEMAKIRAFKLLWINMLQAWGLELAFPCVSAVFKPTAYADDLYTNMIRATTMAMSAVLGGADRLTVLPYDAGREKEAAYPPEFSRRIARNVQHLLKMESSLTEALDPMAGSYYLEKLVQQMCERVWAGL